MHSRLTILPPDAYQTLTRAAEVLEADPHGAKVLRLSDGSMLKLFRRKRLITSAAWYPYALRFVDNAEALALRNIPVPRVTAVWRVPSVKRDAVHYQPLPGESLRMLLRRGLDIGMRQQLRSQFTAFVIHLHALGIYFRSLHLGNVILTPDGKLGLIDFADLRICRRPLPVFMRRRNIQRMLGIAEERDWVDVEAILSRRVV